MAARDQQVSQAIRVAIGDPAPRGALARLAEKLGTSPANVSRWYSLQSTPDPQLWPRIEQALELPPGTLRSVGSVSQLDDAAELRALVTALSIAQAELSERLAELGAEVAQLRGRTRQDVAASG